MFAPLRRDVIIAVEDRAVPTTLWRPAHSKPRSLVLVGHGGYGHRKDARMSAIAEMLATEHQAAVLLVDGPIHGDRRADGILDTDHVKAEWRGYWHDNPHIEAMVNDWRAALEWALKCTGQLPVGFFGLSMGTLYGLPLIAQEPLIQSAVLGMWGADNLVGGRLVADARQIEIPTLFYIRLADHLFSREGMLSIFGELKTTNKFLVAEEGRHEPPNATTTEWLLENLMQRLRSRGIARDSLDPTIEPRNSPFSNCSGCSAPAPGAASPGRTEEFLLGGSLNRSRCHQAAPGGGSGGCDE